MSFLRFIDQLSFKKILGITVFLGLLVSVPTTVWLVQQKTHLLGEAYIQKPIPLTFPKPSYGPLPAGEPKITLVWPFLGKVGDVVFVQGENFGMNPLDKELNFAGIRIPDEKIVNWQDKQIEFLIPEGAQVGGLEIRLGSRKVAWNYPVSIYDLSTTTQIVKKGNKLQVIRGPAKGKLTYWMEDFEKFEVEVEGTNFIEIPSDGRDVLSLLLYDDKGKLINFFVEPDDFGF